MEMQNTTQQVKEHVLVYPGRVVETEELSYIKESFLKEGKATFDVCWFDHGVCVLMASSERFEMALELELPITLVKYGLYDFVHISKFGFTADDTNPELVDENGAVLVKDLFFVCLLNCTPYYEIEAYMTKGAPIYTLTPKEQFMKDMRLNQTGVDVHKAYIELGMNEETSFDVYFEYLRDKLNERDDYRRPYQTNMWKF
jgi:hypothetical protein